MTTHGEDMEQCFTDGIEHLNKHVHHLEDSTYFENCLIENILAKRSITAINSLLQSGASVNTATATGTRPLDVAVEYEYVECIQLLINNGASINSTNEEGLTPLLIAASKGSETVIKTLIENGAVVNYCDAADNDVTEDIRQRGYFTYEPLNIAIENNHVQCVKLLLESGATVNKQYYMGYEINLVPLHHKECMELLLQYGADPNVFSRSGITPLMKACKEGRKDIVELLLKYGANVHTHCPLPFDKKSAIIFGVRSGALDIVKTLIMNGAKPSKETGSKYGPLHTAVMADSPVICSYLLSINVCVDELAEDSCTPLMLCAKLEGLDEREAIFKVLLQHGADPNKHATFNPGFLCTQSTLVEYVRHNHRNLNIKVIQMLLRHGAKVNVRCFLSSGQLDPFGILPYLSHTKDFRILQLLVQSAKHFDTGSIMDENTLSKSCREFICHHASQSLKRIVRLELMDKFAKQLIEEVDCFELPTTLKQYLLFET